MSKAVVGFYEHEIRLTCSYKYPIQHTIQLVNISLSYGLFVYTTKAMNTTVNFNNPKATNFCFFMQSLFSGEMQTFSQCKFYFFPVNPYQHIREVYIQFFQCLQFDNFTLENLHNAEWSSFYMQHRSETILECFSLCQAQ